MRSVWPLLLAVLSALPSCSTQRGSAPPPRRRTKSAFTLRVDAIGVDRAESLRVLEMPQRELHKRLGAYALRLTARQQISAPGQPVRKLDQEVTLRVDAKGQYQLVKHTSPQHGQEVVWVGGTLYPRQRFDKFLARPPRGPEEVGELAERGAGLLAAQARLLAPFIDFELRKRGERAGRKTLELGLRLRDKPQAQPGELPATRRWRRSLRVEAVKGRIVADALTGAPLAADLTARWTFRVPSSPEPRTGIPESFGTRRGKVSLTLELELQLGAGAPIAAPRAEEVVDVRRRRLELERQMVEGERPLDPTYRRRWGGIPR